MLRELKKIRINTNSLAIKKLDLLKCWDFKKNNINPYEIGLTSREYVWWICDKCKYAWKNNIYTQVKRKNICRKCMGRIYLQYENAKKLNIKLKIENRNEYIEYCKIYKELPVNARIAYKEFWKGWGEYLGTNRKRQNCFLKYIEAKRLVQKLGIKFFREYREIYKKHKGLPCHPDDIYKDEWEGWTIFLDQGYKIN